MTSPPTAASHRVRSVRSLARAAGSALVPLIAAAGLAQPSAAAVLSSTFGTTCAVQPAGTVTCWGVNDAGQAGAPATVADTGVAPTVVPGIDDAVAVAAGTSHTCALRATGSVLCWGENAVGQLGNGTTTGSSTPTRVPGIDDAISLAAGASATCALRWSGRVSCWGGDVAPATAGEGSGNRTTPVDIAGIAGATGITIAGPYFCAATTGAQGTACWWNRTARPGGGTVASTTRQRAPIDGLADAASVAISPSDTACMVRRAGDMRCWGNNTAGQFGTGTASLSPPSAPVTVPDVDDARAVAVGIDSVCAVRSTEGFVDCWGGTSWGTAGDPAATTGRSIGGLPAALRPVRMTGTTGTVQLAMGDSYACAADGSGAVRCWGNGNGMRLGRAVTGANPVPTLVPGVAVATGANYPGSVTPGGDSMTTTGRRLTQVVSRLARRAAGSPSGVVVVGRYVGLSRYAVPALPDGTCPKAVRVRVRVRTQVVARALAVTTRANGCAVSGALTLRASVKASRASVRISGPGLTATERTVTA